MWNMPHTYLPRAKVAIIRHVARCWAEEKLSPKGLTGPPIAQTHAICQQMREKAIDETPLTVETERQKKALEIPDNSDRRTPASKTLELQNCGAMEEPVALLFDIQTKLNVIRSAQRPRRSVSSGIASYIRFCHIIEMTPFPVLPHTVKRWSPTCNPGKTFGLCFNHVRKASILLSSHGNWATTEIRTIAKGLRIAQDRSYDCPNFVHSADIMRIVDNEANFATFARIDSLSYAFPLRVPSETICLSRAKDIDTSFASWARRPMP